MIQQGMSSKIFLNVSYMSKLNQISTGIKKQKGVKDRFKESMSIAKSGNIYMLECSSFIITFTILQWLLKDLIFIRAET